MATWTTDENPLMHSQTQNGFRSHANTATSGSGGRGPESAIGGVLTSAENGQTGLQQTLRQIPMPNVRAAAQWDHVSTHPPMAQTYVGPLTGSMPRGGALFNGNGTVQNPWDAPYAYSFAAIPGVPAPLYGGHDYHQRLMAISRYQLANPLHPHSYDPSDPRSTGIPLFLTQRTSAGASQHHAYIPPAPSVREGSLPERQNKPPSRSQISVEHQTPAQTSPGTSKGRTKANAAPIHGPLKKQKAKFVYHPQLQCVLSTLPSVKSYLQTPHGRRTRQKKVAKKTEKANAAARIRLIETDCTEDGNAKEVASHCSPAEQKLAISVVAFLVAAQETM